MIRIVVLIGLAIVAFIVLAFLLSRLMGTRSAPEHQVRRVRRNVANDQSGSDPSFMHGAMTGMVVNSMLHSAGSSSASGASTPDARPGDGDANAPTGETRGESGPSDIGSSDSSSSGDTGSSCSGGSSCSSSSSCSSGSSCSSSS